MSLTSLQSASTRESTRSYHHQSPSDMSFTHPALPAAGYRRLASRLDATYASTRGYASPLFILFSSISTMFGHTENSGELSRAINIYQVSVVHVPTYTFVSELGGVVTVEARTECAQSACAYNIVSEFSWTVHNLVLLAAGTAEPLSGRPIAASLQSCVSQAFAGCFSRSCRPRSAQPPPLPLPLCSFHFVHSDPKRRLPWQLKIRL